MIPHRSRRRPGLAVSTALVLFALLASCSNPVDSTTSGSTSKGIVLPSPTIPPFAVFTDLYVSSTAPNNTANGKTAMTPFKTITFALAKAKLLGPTVNTPVIIHLGPGLYDHINNGETFPLLMDTPNVSIVGNVNSKGQGSFPNYTLISPDITSLGSRQRAAIIISGSNTSVKGVAFEELDPTNANGFSAQLVDGIDVVGGNNIVIQNCTFVYNFFGISVNSNTVKGATSVWIQSNVVEKNFFGIRFLYNDSPTNQAGESPSIIWGNDIRYNGVGVELSAIFDNLGLVPPSLGDSRGGSGKNNISHNNQRFSGSFGDDADLSIDSRLPNPTTFFLENNTWSSASNGFATGVIDFGNNANVNLVTNGATQANPNAPAFF